MTILHLLASVHDGFIGSRYFSCSVHIFKALFQPNKIHIELTLVKSKELNNAQPKLPKAQVFTSNGRNQCGFSSMPRKQF